MLGGRPSAGLCCRSNLPFDTLIASFETLRAMGDKQQPAARTRSAQLWEEEAEREIHSESLPSGCCCLLPCIRQGCLVQ